jgi:L-lysine 2,3-aminomutase
MGLDDPQPRERGRAAAVLIPLDAEEAMLALMSYHHSEDDLRRAKLPSRTEHEPRPGR